MDLPPETQARLAGQLAPLVGRLERSLAACVDPLILGISGAQGTGKSTISELLRGRLAERGLRPVVLSIDDLYLTRAERSALAETVHPLLQTRGVPGTHDLALGHQLFDALLTAGPDTRTALPVFDKAVDDRAPEPRIFTGRPDLILFEGWCVGCRPQADCRQAINELETREDADGRWRMFVNQALAGSYADFFARFDILVLLQAPGMESVFHWRLQQEQELARRAGTAGTRVMDAAQIRHFIMHYERLTRWMLEDLPGRADMVFEYDVNHRITRVLGA